MQEKSKSQSRRGGSGNSTYKYLILAIAVMALISAVIYIFVKKDNEREQQEVIESKQQQHAEIIEHRENETELPLGNYVGVLRQNNEVAIVSRNEDEIVAEIPGYVDGLMVTTLGSGLFENSSVEVVVIPDSVMRIEDNCFKNCKKLKTIIIPEGVTFLGAHAFDGCESLNQLDIPLGVTRIGAGCFANCTSLSTVNLPSYLEVLEEDTFRNSAITSAKLYTTFEIHAHAFADCPNLTVVTIGAITKSIDNTAFDGSENVVINTTENSCAWKYGVEHDFTVIAGKTR